MTRAKLFFAVATYTIVVVVLGVVLPILLPTEAPVRGEAITTTPSNAAASFDGKGKPTFPTDASLAAESECGAETPEPPSTPAPSTDEYCVDVHPRCVALAAAGECSAKPDELARRCPKACGVCSGRKSGQVKDKKQIVSGDTDEMAKIMEILYEGKWHAESSWGHNSSCISYSGDCGFMAAGGSCDDESMQVFCAPVCGTCDKQSRYRILDRCIRRSSMRAKYPDTEKREAECRSRATGPQLLNSTTPEPIFFEIPREGRYNEPGAKASWPQHPHVAQIFSRLSLVEESEQVFQYHCVGEIYGLSKTNGLLLWASHHCADDSQFTASSLIVRVFSESAAQQDDGCLARVSRIYEYEPGEGDFFLDKDNTKRRAESDISVIELEEGQCIDSSKLALPVWDGPDGVLGSLPKNVIPKSLLNQSLSLTFESSNWSEQYKCLDGDYGDLSFPSQIKAVNKGLVEGLNRTLAFCGQEYSLHPTDDFEKMNRYRWGWVEESGTMRMQLQAIPLAIWHHPCALGLHKLQGVTQWPFKAICAEPLLDNMDGSQIGDSGGGVVRYDPVHKKYYLVGLLSRGTPKYDPYTTDFVSPIDRSVDDYFRKWLKGREE